MNAQFSPRLTVRLAGALAIAGSLTLGACARPAPAAKPATSPESVRPGVNDKYAEDGAVERWTERFEHDGREVFDQREAIIAALELPEGANVVDFGAGTGLFTPLLADAVGDQGRVLAVDIIPAFVQEVAQENAGRPNVTVRQVDPLGPELEAGAYDLVYVCDVYHHVEYPSAVLERLFAGLKPGGRLVIVDFRRIEGVTSARMLKHVRANQATVRAEVEAAGFVHREDRDWMRENYFTVFERP